MQLHINRRIRDKAMVLGLPAEKFLPCLALMCLPAIFVLFYPIFTIVWAAWAFGAYWFYRNAGRLLKNLSYGKQFPAHLKNR